MAHTVDDLWETIADCRPPAIAVWLPLEVVDEAGSLKMAIDVPHLGDAVIRRDKALLLIMDTPLSASLAKRELDFCLPDARTTKPEFTLRPRPAEPAATAVLPS